MAATHEPLLATQAYVAKELNTYGHTASSANKNASSNVSVAVDTVLVVWFVPSVYPAA